MGLWRGDEAEFGMLLGKGLDGVNKVKDVSNVPSAWVKSRIEQTNKK